MPESVLVTGANRGIGLELVKQLLRKEEKPPKVLLATCRDPQGPRAQELRALASTHPNLVILQLEVTDPASVQSAAKEAESHLGGRGLNLLVNNAGVMPACTLESATTKGMLDVYNVNLVGPMLVTKAFLPLLKRAAQASPDTALSCAKAAIVNMSSFLSSIEKVPVMYHSTPAISYRCSKAALNMLTKLQSMGYKEDGILCTALHPGWVKTDMGTEEADLTVEESVAGILGVLRGLSEKHHGALVTWEGKALPW
nr:C-signal-like [Anolis sagrei ordinatus]